MKGLWTMAFVVCVGAAVCGAAGAADKTVTIVMLGDSTTLCRDSEPGKKLTDRVQAHLTHDFKLNVNVVNAGVGSDTIKGGFRRLQRDVFKHDPDLVTISFGLNDTGLLTPEEFDEFLVKTVDAIQAESKAKVLLVTSTPFVNSKHFWNSRFAEKGGLDEYMDANICAKMRVLAEKHKLAICDLHTLFKAEFRTDPALEAKVIRSDGVHLTDEGNALAARYLAPAIAAELRAKEGAAE